MNDMREIGENEKVNNFISISCLNLAFCDSQPPIKVIRDLNLKIEQHEFITIVGPSGCGKTTFLKTIGGLLNENDRDLKIDGTIKIKGHPPEIAKKKRMFGFAFQNPVLLPWRSVRDNIKLSCELIGLESKMVEIKINNLLNLMEIRAFEMAYPQQLSGGMKQRVNIARALVHEPSILLMDEPFGALDELTRDRLNDALLTIHNLKKTTILFVTHNLAEAVYLSNRVIVFSKRPANICAVLRIDLPRERSDRVKASQRYFELLEQLRNLVKKATEGIL